MSEPRTFDAAIADAANSLDQLFRQRHTMGDVEAELRSLMAKHRAALLADRPEVAAIIGMLEGYIANALPGIDTEIMRRSRATLESLAAQLAASQAKLSKVEAERDALKEQMKFPLHKGAVYGYPEMIKALKEDAELLDWLDKTGLESGHGFCHEGYGDYRYYANPNVGVAWPTARQVIRAAIADEKDKA